MTDTENTQQPEQETAVVAKPMDNGSPKEVNEHFMAQAMSIMSANQYTPTQSQVDKMLGLQEKSMDYRHAERTTFSPFLISSLVVFGIVVLSIMGTFVFCVFYAPQYVPQIITGAFGLLSGGGIGYSIGNNKKSRKDDA